jgi:hypothetical protein
MRKASSINEWLDAVRSLLTERYGIDLADVGLNATTASTLWRAEIPDALVRRLGEKYDLVDIRPKAFH